MDVELPDGQVVEGVPDGMSQRDLVSLLSKNGYDTSWYKAPEPGLLDRVKGALTPDPDRAPMPSTADTINAPSGEFDTGASEAPEGRISMPGSVMDGYTPRENGQGVPIDRGMVPMRQDYYDTARSGLLAAPLEAHGQAAQGGGQVGKVARESLPGRLENLERDISGDTTPRTQQELKDDTETSLRVQPLRSEEAKEANRQWLTENSKAVIEGLKRSQHFQRPDEEAQAEFDRMVRNGYKPDWLLEDMPKATLAQSISANFDTTGPSLKKALLGLSEAAGDQPFLQLPWVDYAKRTPRELEAMVSDLDKQIRAGRNVGGKIVSGSWNDVVSSMGPSLATNLPPLMAASLVAARNPAAGMAIASGGLGVMGMQKFGDSYLKGQMKGLSAGDNLVHASLAAAAEVIPEKLSLNALFAVFKTMGKGAAVETVKAFAKQQLTEHTTEQITTISDHLIDKAYTEPDKSLESLWSEMKQTAMATAIQAPLLAGGGMLSHGVGQAAVAAKQKYDQSRDITAGMEFNPNAIEAAARGALDPARAQMEQVGQVAPPVVPTATPADVGAAPTPEAASTAIAEIGASLGGTAPISETLTTTQAEIDALLADPLTELAALPQTTAIDTQIGAIGSQPEAAAAGLLSGGVSPFDPFLAQGANGHWSLSRPIDNQAPEFVSALIDELDRRNQPGATNAPQAAQAQQSPAALPQVPQASPETGAVPGELTPAAKPADDLNAMFDDVLGEQAPARESAPKPDGFREEAPLKTGHRMFTPEKYDRDDRRVTVDFPDGTRFSGDLVRGGGDLADWIEDNNPASPDKLPASLVKVRETASGVPEKVQPQTAKVQPAPPNSTEMGAHQNMLPPGLRVFSQTGSGGKGNDYQMTVEFPDGHREQYVGELGGMTNRVIRVGVKDGLNSLPEIFKAHLLDKVDGGPQIADAAFVPMKPGAQTDMVPPVAQKSITRTRGGKLEITGFDEDEVADVLKTAKIKATVTASKDGKLLVSTVDRAGNPEKMPIKVQNAINKALMPAADAVKKARKYTGNLRNDVNLIAPGLYAEVARGGDGEGMDGVDMSLVAERLRAEGFMLPDTETGKDSDAVLELIRQDIANGGGTLNERRQTEALNEEAKKAHRQNVLRLADEYGIVTKNGIIPRRLEDIEADLKPAIEREIGLAGKGMSDTYTAGLEAGVPMEELDAILDQVEDYYKGDQSPDRDVLKYREQTNALQERIDAYHQGRNAEGQDPGDNQLQAEPGEAFGGNLPTGQALEDFNLEQQSAEEAQAELDESAARDAKRLEDERRAEQKRQSELEAGSFTLSGSDRPADVLAAQGQGGLFDAPANEAATSPTNDRPAPTPAQMEAGNYKKGHFTLHGLDISIENPAGSERVAKDGSWRVVMPVHYGYIKGTVGADKDHVDVFVGPNPESRSVWIINQIVADTSPALFDEHKVLLGFDTAAEAKGAYLGSFQGDYGLNVFGNMTAKLNIDTLNDKIQSGELGRKKFVGPVGDYVEAEKMHPNATAPEHVADDTGVTVSELKQIAKVFREAIEDGEDADVTHIFDSPTKGEIVNLEKKSGIVAKNVDGKRVYSRTGGWMTVEEAKAEIQKWRDNAEAQYDNYETRSANSRKIVISLFDLTGKWSQPWEEAGYQVYRFDIQNGDEADHNGETINIGDINNFSVDFFNDIFGSFDGLDVHAILAACPCTDFAVSGARHFAAKDEDGRTVSSIKLVKAAMATIEYFKPAIWALENPVGRIEELTGLPPWRLSFDPNHLGDPYTKKTLIWGRFNADLPVAPVEPTEGSKMWSQYGGKSQETKNARSATPEGFAYGFFQANNAADHPALAIAGKYDRLDREIIEAAVALGITAEQIDEAVEDLYYMDMDDAAANKAIDELPLPTKKAKVSVTAPDDGRQFGQTPVEPEAAPADEFSAGPEQIMDGEVTPEQKAKRTRRTKPKPGAFATPEQEIDRIRTVSSIKNLTARLAKNLRKDDGDRKRLQRNLAELEKDLSFLPIGRWSDESAPEINDLAKLWRSSGLPTDLADNSILKQYLDGAGLFIDAVAAGKSLDEQYDIYNGVKGAIRVSKEYIAREAEKRKTGERGVSLITRHQKLDAKIDELTDDMIVRMAKELGVPYNREVLVMKDAIKKAHPDDQDKALVAIGQGQDGMFLKTADEKAYTRLKETVVKFNSGMSRIADLEASSRAAGGHTQTGIGVVIGEVSRPAMKKLAKAILNWNTPVFVDSGAFGKNLSFEEFDKVLDNYDLLLNDIYEANEVEDYSYPRPLLVMPDEVGNQARTLELIEHFKRWISGEVRAETSRPVVNLQKGELSLADVYRRTVEILGTTRFIVGLPANKSAITDSELAEFLREIKPKDVHFLGAAADSILEPLLKIVATNSPFTNVTADASPILSKIVPETKKGKPRADAIRDNIFNENDPGVIPDMMESEYSAAQKKSAQLDEVDQWMASYAKVRKWGPGDSGKAWDEYVLQNRVQDVSEAEFKKAYDNRFPANLDAMFGDILAEEAKATPARELTIDDVPPARLKKITVAVDAVVGDEIESMMVPATEALADVEREIDAFKLLLDCVRTGK